MWLESESMHQQTPLRCSRAAEWRSCSGLQKARRSIQCCADGDSLPSGCTARRLPPGSRVLRRADVPFLGVPSKCGGFAGPTPVRFQSVRDRRFGVGGSSVHWP